MKLKCRRGKLAGVEGWYSARGGEAHKDLFLTSSGWDSAAGGNVDGNVEFGVEEGKPWVGGVRQMRVLGLKNGIIRGGKNLIKVDKPKDETQICWVIEPGGFFGCCEDRGLPTR